MKRKPGNAEEMDLVEKLADLEHQRWAHWQDYVHSKGVRNPDGSITLPAELVAHWERLIATRYRALTHAEQESDREQVRRYLPFILSTFLKTDR